MAEHTLTVDLHQLKLLRGVVKMKAAASRKRAAKSGFVPKPGCRNLDISKAESLERLLEQIDELLATEQSDP